MSRNSLFCCAIYFTIIVSCYGERSASDSFDYSDEIDTFMFPRPSSASRSGYRRNSDPFEHRERKYSYDSPSSYRHSTPAFPKSGSNHKSERYETSYAYETTDKPKYISYSYGRSSKNKGGNNNNKGTYFNPADDDFEASHPEETFDIPDESELVHRPKNPRFQSLLDRSGISV
ncbi:hypothetical protein O3M35_003231 [Rhynocoris fuscipes]|uniref:Uncharacterized protein n=1 Tax=Rhynocoris fuscipes TaxID=488301 RepID=A0AAW1CQX8_9HEMI